MASIWEGTAVAAAVAEGSATATAATADVTSGVTAGVAEAPQAMVTKTTKAVDIGQDILKFGGEIPRPMLDLISFTEERTFVPLRTPGH